MKQSSTIALCVAFCTSSFARASLKLSHQHELQTSSKATPDQEQFKRETWLATHLQDQFEMSRGGQIAPQSGLNMPWNYDEIKPRNARDDCGKGSDSIQAKVDRQMKQASEKGKLAASRLSNQN